METVAWSQDIYRFSVFFAAIVLPPLVANPGCRLWLYYFYSIALFLADRTAKSRPMIGYCH